MTVHCTGLVHVHCFSVSMISFIIIIINVHVPDQYSERSCIHVLEVSIVSLFLWYLLLLLNNNNERYHRNRETIYTSDTCIHDCSLYWSGTCTLIIIIIKDIIETEKQSIPLTHVYMTQYSERSCIHVSEVSIVSLFLWYLSLLLLLMYMYQTSTVNGHVYMRQRYRLFLCFYDIFYYYYINNNNNERYHRNRETIYTSDTCIHDRSLYWSGTCTLIIMIIKDIIEREKQSIPLTHVHYYYYY
jgi:hypothetical protein